MKLSPIEVHQIIEYIKLAGVEFDAADVDEDVTSVLWQYGYCDSLGEEDLAALRQELLPLGLKREVAEISMLVHEQAREQGMW